MLRPPAGSSLGAAGGEEIEEDSASSGAPALDAGDCCRFCWKEGLASGSPRRRCAQAGAEEPATKATDAAKAVPRRARRVASRKPSRMGLVTILKMSIMVLIGASRLL